MIKNIKIIKDIKVCFFQKVLTLSDNFFNLFPMIIQEEKII